MPLPEQVTNTYIKSMPLPEQATNTIHKEHALARTGPMWQLPWLYANEGAGQLCRFLTKLYLQVIK